jgi:hypothetical protein
MKSIIIVAAIVLAASTTASAQSSGPGSALLGAGMTGRYVAPSYYPPRRLKASDVRRRASGRPARPPYPTTPPYRGSFFAGGNR